MRLNRLFTLTTGILLTLVSAMLIRTVLQDWRAVSVARIGLQIMDRAYLALQVAEVVSLECGPTSILLADGDEPDPAERAKVLAARAASDAVITLTLNRLYDTSETQHQAAIDKINQAQQQLVQARAEADRVAALPRAERVAGTGRATKHPIEMMFGVADTTMEVVTILSADAKRAFPELTLPFAGSRLTADLREYAGRLGSRFTLAMTTQAPLDADEKRDIGILIGRIEQLHTLVTVLAQVTLSPPSVTAAIANMDQHYFAKGLPMAASMAAIGATSGTYGLTIPQFLARYMPEMTSIITLRDAMSHVARQGAANNYALAQHDLLVDAVIGALVMLIEIGVLLVVRRRLLRPLLRTTAAVVAIAQGQLDTPLHASRRTDEIGDLKNAVAALKKTSIAKRQLEAEREYLIEQLRHASGTDFLTGLLNRREFNTRASQQLALAKRRDWPVALIVFDIDHFKSINDRFGHAVGDAVLTQIAHIAQREFRVTDNLARYGGEEFIAMISDCNADKAIELAERVRAAIEKSAFATDVSEPFSVTASFGVGSARASSVPDVDTFFQLADQALYSAKASGRNRVSADVARLMSSLLH
jgi:diguanylate cyclase (GGDEF)-like protein